MPCRLAEIEENNFDQFVCEEGMLLHGELPKPDEQDDSEDEYNEYSGDEYEQLIEDRYKGTYMDSDTIKREDMLTEIEKERHETIKHNLKELKAVGIDPARLNSMAMSLFGSKVKASGKSTKEGNNKVGHGIDPDYIPPEGVEILSSCSDNDESSRSQAKKAKLMSPGKKKSTSTTQVLRKSQRIPGVTSSLPTEPIANHAEGMSVMVAQPSELPLSPTDEANQHSCLPNVGGSRDREAMAIVGDYATSVAYAIGESIRSHAPVRDIRWRDIDFGIKESIILCVGVKKEKREQSLLERFKDTHIRHRHEEEVWINTKAKEVHVLWHFLPSMKSRSACFKAVRCSDVFIYADNGGVGFTDKIAKKLAEQSQPGVTNPQSEVQVSIDVLGKRSGYLKGYGIRKSTFATQSQPVPNSEVVSLKELVADQAKLIADYAKKFETMMLFMATKNGVDPATIPRLI
ncbi:hypothetical protein RHSIM_Rhsim08G0062000 [Rhododendron simsii]|uniref:Uncharacterized protein n=1 Tax=Rhododendron simsii TaxID=118357 RepID=A0A834LGQ7_RHOSS|nr:hypothetical protein RHSIM_Rhsim08G0062000 [Rhododendron simsii]